jgi:hypothetical protein
LFRVISNYTRRAKAKWFLEHTWMKYSKTQDSVYCAPCRFFGPYMLIVFNSKSSLIHYTFDKIKFLSQLHICIALLYILFLKIYAQMLTCCSWKLGFRGIIFSAKKLQECRILHHLPQTPCRKATSARWRRVTSTDF